MKNTKNIKIIKIDKIENKKIYLFIEKINLMNLIKPKYIILTNINNITKDEIKLERNKLKYSLNLIINNLSIDFKINLIKQIYEILFIINNLNLPHQNLKLSNILIENDNIYLCDYFINDIRKDYIKVDDIYSFGNIIKKLLNYYNNDSNISLNYINKSFKEIKIINNNSYKDDLDINNIQLIINNNIKYIPNQSIMNKLINYHNSSNDTSKWLFTIINYLFLYKEIIKENCDTDIEFKDEVYMCYDDSVESVINDYNSNEESESFNAENLNNIDFSDEDNYLYDDSDEDVNDTDYSSDEYESNENDTEVENDDDDDSIGSFDLNLTDSLINKVQDLNTIQIDKIIYEKVKDNYTINLNGILK